MKNKIIFKTLMLKGEAGSTIVSMEKTGHVGTADIYTITFNDGSTTEISLENMSAITSVEMTSSTDTEDIYTITCADGSTQTFSVLNHNADIAAMSDDIDVMSDNIDVMDARLDNFLATQTGVSNGTLRTETTLFSSTVPSMGNDENNSGYFDLEDSVDNYDEIVIRYSAFSGKSAVVTIKPDDIPVAGGSDSPMHWSEIEPNNQITIDAQNGDRSVHRFMAFTAYKFIDVDRVSIDAFVWGWNGSANSNGVVSSSFTKAWNSTNGAWQTSGFIGGIYSITGIKYEEAGTSKDPELADLRVGADGVTYASAGEGVRSQVSDLKEDLTLELDGDSVTTNGSLLINGYYLKADGTLGSSANFDIYKYNIDDADLISVTTTGYNSTVAIASNSNYDETSIIGKTFSPNSNVIIKTDDRPVTMGQWTEEGSIDGFAYLYVSCYKTATPTVVGHEGGLKGKTYKNTDDITGIQAEMLSAVESYFGLLYTADRWSMFSNDADNLPTNRIFGISYYTNVSHLPTDTFVGHIMTYAPYYGATNIALQIAVYGNSKEFYTRTKYGNTWSNWIKLGLNEDIESILTTLNTKTFMGVSGSALPSSDFNDFTFGAYALNSSLSNFTNTPPTATKQGALIAFKPQSDIVYQFYLDGDNIIHERRKWGSTWSAWHKVLTETDIYSLNPVLPSVALFEKIGVIGDSYASGEVYVSGSAVNYYNFSWGQILARRNGATCVNFSRGGLTTKTWLSDNKGLSLLLSSDPQDLYIIALGINDNTQIYNSEYSLGTDADFDLSDYANTPDTFYGNMCKIIGNIKTKAPNAKIILSTMAINGSATQESVNGAIEDCAELASIPVIKQYTDNFFLSDYYVNGKVGGHPTAPVYSAMAVALERMISQCMQDNYEYFYDYVTPA